MMLAIVLVELLPGVEVRAADLAIVFVCMCHFELR